MKQHILDNVTEYSPQELVDYIQQGIVTYDALRYETDERFSVENRKEVLRLLQATEEEYWQKVLSDNSVAAFTIYINAYPYGEHYDEAIQRKLGIESEEQRIAEEKKYEKAWSNVDSNSIESLQRFVQEFPKHIKVPEAKRRINELIEEERKKDPEVLVQNIKEISINPIYTPEQKVYNTLKCIKDYLDDLPKGKSVLLDIIKNDNNLLGVGLIQELLKMGTLSLLELEEIGIDTCFLGKLNTKSSLSPLPSPKYRLERVKKKSTEVYFWGIPSSGKTCALGAVLSVAASGRVAKSMDPDPNSQGYGYMMHLINLFKHGQVVDLVEGTAVDAFYEMGFDLVDQDNKLHPITCIDMAGELMHCMYKANSGDELKNDEKEMLNVLKAVLGDRRTGNRKIHIFVIEYGAELRKIDNLTQDIYLSGATTYIKQTGIFNKDTDAVYIMITKADKAKAANDSVFQQYINQHYHGFYKNLQQICQDNEINGGRVEKLAFSLGTVCFQNYCLFNEVPAANVVNIILQRSYGRKNKGWLTFLIDLFRG